MHYLRRLPPLLRLASMLGLLCILAALLLFGQLFATLLRLLPLDSYRVLMMAMNLGMLGATYSFVVRHYTARFADQQSGPFPLGSWQSQVRTMMLVAALPVSALVLAAFIPPTASAFQVIFLISIIGAIISLVVGLSMVSGRQAVD